MARPYGQKFLLALHRSKSDTLGVELARLCVKARLPATLVASVLNTSSTTVYAWFRGQGVREHKRKVVEAFIESVKEGLKDRILPTEKLEDAAFYFVNKAYRSHAKKKR